MIENETENESVQVEETKTDQPTNENRLSISEVEKMIDEKLGIFIDKFLKKPEEAKPDITESESEKINENEEF